MRTIKILAIALIVVCMVFIVSMTQAADILYPVYGGGSKRLAEMGDTSDAEVVTGRTQYASTMNGVGVQDDTGYVLVDLSDTTNFPHTGTTNVAITGCYGQASIAASALWDFSVGTVTAIDGTGTTLKKICGTYATFVGTILSDTWGYTFPGSGVIDSSIMAVDIAIAGITTSTDLAGPAGTVNVAVGDIIAFADEQSGSTALTFKILITYWTK